MTILGVILLIAGVISAVYGGILNNSIEAQLESLLTKGSANPGSVWLYVGIAAAVIGVILIVVGLKKRSQK